MNFIISFIIILLYSIIRIHEISALAITPFMYVHKYTTNLVIEEQKEKANIIFPNTFYSNYIPSFEINMPIYITDYLYLKLFFMTICILIIPYVFIKSVFLNKNRFYKHENIHKYHHLFNIVMLYLFILSSIMYKIIPYSFEFSFRNYNNIYMMELDTTISLDAIFNKIYIIYILILIILLLYIYMYTKNIVIKPYWYVLPLIGIYTIYNDIYFTILMNLNALILINAFKFININIKNLYLIKFYRRITIRNSHIKTILRNIRTHS
uniref:Uncharacterized protein n=1 Tax=Stachyamoeba lipophora TaxID=463046 RepID=A0A0B5GFW9_STALP|nr:hypothetical protein [Stachyamoeba lipophora]AJF22907.1 hypothetical protein [Stachyamoeba lipophora]